MRDTQPMLSLAMRAGVGVGKISSTPTPTPTPAKIADSDRLRLRLRLRLRSPGNRHAFFLHTKVLVYLFSSSSYELTGLIQNAQFLWIN